MSRRTDRRSSGSGGSTGAAHALGLAVALLLAACISELGSVGPGEQRADGFTLTVSVTNVGNGFGRAEVIFAAGPTQNPCTAILGPGQSCAPFVRAFVSPETAQIDVDAEPGSRFVGWTGAHCTGTSTECTVQDQSADFDTEIAVEPRFDLVEGG